MLPIYGGSIIGLFNPIPVIQLSAELELRVNINLDGTTVTLKTIGIRFVF
jgi:hypothetical protein